jgi:hypothetical protein
VCPAVRNNGPSTDTIQSWFQLVFMFLTVDEMLPKLVACLLAAGLSMVGCALSHWETTLAAPRPGARDSCAGISTHLRLRLSGGGDEAADLTEVQANALLEGAEEDESAPGSLLKILSDYGGSANVARLGCQRITASLTDAGSNETQSAAFRTAYAAAGGAKCVLETLKLHSSKGDPLVIAAVCTALGKLLAGPPNHAAEGEDLWDEDCDATPIRVGCGRAGAAQVVIEVLSSYAAAAQHAAAEQDAAAVQVMRVWRRKGLCAKARLHHVTVHVAAPPQEALCKIRQTLHPKP